MSNSPIATILFLITVGVWLWVLSEWSRSVKSPEMLVSKIWEHYFEEPITDAWELGLTLTLTCTLSFVVGSTMFLLLTWMLGVNPRC